jgi:hypothetical protein
MQKQRSEYDSPVDTLVVYPALSGIYPCSSVAEILKVCPQAWLLHRGKSAAKKGGNHMLIEYINKAMSKKVELEKRTHETDNQT